MLTLVARAPASLHSLASFKFILGRFLASFALAFFNFILCGSDHSVRLRLLDWDTTLLEEDIIVTVDTKTASKLLHEVLNCCPVFYMDSTK